ncbi:S8 family serine peptidase [Citricoccus sp. NPDC055426]|uniref:S8 family peptidase n=1 Tax=Citricoccus sp. NPDC055426 TaxID=3155536 RepID=UPI0034429C90
MKHHLVLKLRAPVAESEGIPDWQVFILDKSRTVTSLTPGVDAVLHADRRDFWVTHEYAAGPEGWTESERRHGLDRTYRIVLDSTAPVPTGTVHRLARLPEVEEVHQLVVARSPIPDTDLFTPLGGTSSSAASIGADFAHALTSGRPEVKVAVLDTGISPRHPELTGAVAEARDFVDLTGLDTTSFLGDVLEADDDPTDELGHGTHVAGIIAGRGVNMEPGMASGCRLMAGRVLATLQTGDGPQGAGIVDNINPAIKWAVDHGAAVINMSVGIRHTGGGLPHADVIAYALEQGVTVVAAAGNDGTPTKYYPGALPGVIAVGACDDEGRIAPFSSYGANITVVAPGVRILSSYAGTGYAVASGTSQSSPHVAGAVALLESLAADHGQRLGPRGVMRILHHTSDRVDARDRDRQSGFGRINLIDAFKWLLGTYSASGAMVPAN